MRIALIGSRGLLGSAIKAAFEGHHEVVCLTRPEVDVLQPETFDAFNSTNLIINCSAYTDVNGAETHQLEADRLNIDGPKNLAVFSRDKGIPLIHFSTDFVFDGEASLAYREDSPTNPLSYYGQSKLRGEQAIQTVLKEHKGFSIFRLQWLYGDNPKTFFSRLFRQYMAGNEIKIIPDEYGSPCSVQFVAETLLSYLDLEPRFDGQVYHLTHDDFCSREECGIFFLQQFGFRGPVLPFVATGGAKRPNFGVMDNTKLQKYLGKPLGSWQTDLLAYVKGLKNA